MKSKADKMVNEMNSVYGRAMNKIIFDHILQSQENAHKDMFALLKSEEEDEIEPPLKKPKHLVLTASNLDKSA